MSYNLEQSFWYTIHNLVCFSCCLVICVLNTIPDVTTTASRQGSYTSHVHCCSGAWYVLCFQSVYLDCVFCASSVCIYSVSTMHHLRISSKGWCSMLTGYPDTIAGAELVEHRSAVRNHELRNHRWILTPQARINTTYTGYLSLLLLTATFDYCQSL